MAKMTSEYCSDGTGIAHNKVYNRHNYVDATNDMAASINQIRTLEESGDFVTAANLAASLKAGGVLSNCIINAASINTIEEETRNLEIFAKGQQSIFYQDDEPDYCEIEDAWIGA